MDIPTFTDLQGDVWSLRLTTANIDKVRDHVKNKAGQPVDLLDMAEKGGFSVLTSDMRLFPTVVFWLIQDQIADRFSIDQFDADHAKEYALDPSLKNITPMQKAANWFGARLGGNQVADMAKAFVEAILNFIDPKVRQRLQTVIEKQEQLREAVLDKAQNETLRQLSAGLEELSSTVPPSSDSTPENGASAS